MKTIIMKYRNCKGLVLTSLLILLTLWQNACAQEKGEVSEKVKELMKDARQGKGVALSDTLISERASREKKVKLLNELKTYNKDASEQVRFAAQSLEFEIAQSTDDPTINKEVVTILSQNITDPSTVVSKQALTLLSKFEKDEFTPSAKNAIVTELRKANKPDPKLVKLVGVAGIETSKDDLKKMVKEHMKQDSLPEVGRWYGKTSWAAHLALARMGDKNAVSYILQRVEGEQDEVLKVTRLLEDVAYIRQPEAVKYIEKYLFSEGRLPSLFEGDEGGRYSQYAITHLADMLVNFPLPSKQGYTKEEIELARSWMRANSNYKIKK